VDTTDSESGGGGIAVAVDKEDCGLATNETNNSQDAARSTQHGSLRRGRSAIPQVLSLGDCSKDLCCRAPPFVCVK